MSDFLMMVGVSGSGKSYYAKHFFGDNCVILSSDDLRKELYGDENDQTHNNEVFAELHKRVIYNLNLGKSVVYDATNLTYKDRKIILSEIQKKVNKEILDTLGIIAVVVNTLIDDCVMQDLARERTVGYDVIWKQVRKFECPQRFEGFTYIHFIHDEVFYIDLKEERSLYQKRMLCFKQHNPHHMSTLGIHSIKVSKEVSKIDESLITSGERDILTEAAHFHDLGKLFTQRFDDKKIAHYYNHANVSSYILCTQPGVFYSFEGTNNFLDKIFIINYHMRMFEISQSEKAIKKYQALWGRKYDLLKLFNECDIKGSL